MVTSINNSISAVTVTPAKLNVGVLTPPNESYKPDSYSDSVKGTKFRELGGTTNHSRNRHPEINRATHLASHDSYVSKLETPTSVVIIGVGVAATAIFCLANKKFRILESIKK